MTFPFSQFPGGESDGTSVPLQQILAESDRLFNEEKTAEVGELLRHWRRRAQLSGDLRGELSLLNELIGHYRMAKDPERGLEAVDAALALLERLKLPDSPSVGTIFLNAATALQSFGMTERALSLYGESSRIYQKHLAGDDKLKAGLFNNMAAAYVETGRFKEAEQHYLNALEILQKQGELMDSAVTFLNLAQLYRSWNNDPLLIRGMVECAMECFDSPQAQRDAYCAHTCRKCASGFGALGYGDIENELNSRADRYYAGH